MAKLFLLLTLCLVQSVDVYPGAKTYIGVDALENLANAYIPHLITKASTSKIPDYPLTIKGLLSQMHFNFTNIEFSKFSIGTNGISVLLDAKSSEVTLQVSGVTVLLSANFTLNWFGTYHGYLSLSLTDALLKFPVTLKESNTIANFVINTVTGNFTSLKFHFVSSNKFLTALSYLEYVWPLYKLDEYLIMHSLTHIGTQLNPGIAFFLKDLAYYEQLGTKDLAIDYRFLALGVQSAQNIQADIEGKFLVPSKKLDLPPYRMNTTLNFMSTASFRLQLTDYFFNTFLWALSDAGYLNQTIDGTNLPELKKYLTTSALRLLVPGLEETFGENLPIVIGFGLGQYPTVQIIENSMKLNTMGVANFFVTKGNSELLAFTVSFNANSAVRGSLYTTETGAYLHCKVNLASSLITNVVVGYSAIGNIDLNNINEGLNWALQSLSGYLYPNLGEFDIKLPIPSYIQLNNPTILVYNRAIEVAGEPNFVLN